MEVETTKMFLEGAIRHPLSADQLSYGRGSMRPDGALTQDCGSVRALVVLKEDKNEIGTGGCDPSHQCSMGYRSYYAQKKMKPIRESCCCPSFLIAIAGPWMCILGAVYVEYPIVQQLTDFIWIGGHPYDNHKLKSVTRILASLGTGIAELKEFYSKLPRLYNSQRFFPFVRHYSVEGRVVNFSYMTYLFPMQSPSKAIFRATAETEGERRNIIVKFTQRYNVEAHRHLATKHLAPELLYCSEDDPDSADLAGLIMVVMEDIDGGQTAYEKYGNDRLDQPIFDRVAEAIGVLHGRNIVFGDLRYPNIMITKDEGVRLIDFDWCGEHGKDTYPGSLNVDRDTNSIDWHPGVERGGTMVKEHDNFMLHNMKPRSDITSLPNPPLATTSSLGKRKKPANENEGEDM
ncbi:hypothetical protein EDB92DRAFT_470325 [Lactarius akahatsu]|uniref:Protein kinase domain-containing protein n=1 Tax=Lactarius akahatsu TaxID=416441 RepID=A0AAD4LUB5_9AGAM|nr:hypothetical protein EDB92DRAFT_470325 [Lactarius akahatsu]